MKGWSYYLSHVWLLIPISLITIVLLPILSLILLFVLIFIFPNGDCGYSSNTISSEQGNFDAVIDGECCDWVCVETIKLHRKSSWWSNTKIFVYNPTSAGERLGRPWTHEAVVVWLNENELEITVDRLDRINTQLQEAC